MSGKKADDLDRIADALEWRNRFDWWMAHKPDSGEVTTFGTDPPPVPPEPPK